MTIDDHLDRLAAQERQEPAPVTNVAARVAESIRQRRATRKRTLGWFAVASAAAAAALLAATLWLPDSTLTVDQNGAYTAPEDYVFAELEVDPS
jgi:hypothetical protein